MEDREIVQLYWDRDEQAIPATAEKYGRYCEVIACNILGNCQDAEECLNDTYLRAWEAMPPHRPQALGAFLGKITRNLALNRWRRNTASRRGGGETPAVLDELLEVVSDGDSVEQEVDRRALLQAVEDFLGRLPPRKRRAFVCRYWYFDSIPAIARACGMTENGVSAMLRRIRVKLRSDLEERGFLL